MTAVEVMKPIVPEVISAIKIESSAFTDTFPSKIAHKSKLPLRLNGSSFFAYHASFSSYLVSNGPIMSSSKFLQSRPSTPRFKPEKIPENTPRTTMIKKVYH